MTQEQEIEGNKGRNKGHGRDAGTGGFENFIALALSEGPLTREELFTRFLRFSTKYGSQSRKIRESLYYRDRVLLDSSLERMLQLGLVTVDDGGVCQLTDEGEKKVSRLKGGSGNYAGRLTSYMNSVETASSASLLVSGLLAALKLAVGFTFNCMGLMADGFGNLIDVLSLMVVSLGGRLRNGRGPTVFIIAAMFAAAAFVGYEAVKRLFLPQTVEAGMITMLVALVSGVVGYVMSVYQGTVGRNSGSLSLIAQSGDSKSDVFVAVVVLAGIVCARFGIFIVDSLVGLAIGFIILKSAIDLTVETVGAAGGKEGFKGGPGERYLRTWTLFVLKEVHSREDIVSEYGESFSVDGLPIAEHFGFAREFDFEGYLDALLEELVAGGLVTAGEDGYCLTSRGRSALRRKLASCRYARER
ncbi:MAG: cation transporter [Dehalococcoidia bacterium]|nr:cation transporter [Dehalococcoidia bacterium]